MTRILITQSGFLLIGRDGRQPVRQVCPHTIRAESEKGCGDWCPLFGDVVISETGDVQVPLCLQVHTCRHSQFEDERD